MSIGNTTQIDGLYYRLDRGDRIVEVGGAWDEFARENDGAAAMADKVLGAPLFDHISGDVTRMFVKTLLDSARLLERPTMRPYRCDAPTLKRFMEMTVMPEENGGLCVRHRKVAEEIMPTPLCFVVQAVGLSSMLVRCSMCGRLKRDGEWGEAEETLDSQLLAARAPIRVIYGVCDSCRQAIRRVA